MSPCATSASIAFAMPTFAAWKASIGARPSLIPRQNRSSKPVRPRGVSSGPITVLYEMCVSATYARDPDFR